MASSITIERLCKNYGPFAALADVSIAIGAGEFVTLLGPSGSGKTTLLMSIAGFSDPDSGSIRIDDQEILHLAPDKRNIGMVFQNYALFPNMSVGENVAYSLKLRKVARAEREERVKRALAAVQMSGFADRRIDQLSGGQRQRIAVARAIVFEPNIVLMDEPLSALDKKLREEMQIELKHLHRRLERTIVYVTHDQKEALTMSDQVVVMNRGKVEQKAGPLEIYDKPATRFVAEFIGSSILAPVVDQPAPGTLAVASGKVAGAGARNLREPLAVIRPEKLEIVAAGHEQPGYVYFDTTVREVIYQGDLAIIYGDLADGCRIHLQQATRRNSLRAIPEAGKPMRIAVHEEDVSVVEGGGVQR